MGDEQQEAPTTQEHKDFFISYTSTNRAWAEWIALQLEDAGYSTIIQAWDMRPGSNFVFEMNEASKHAERTIIVLSTNYLASDYAFSEWGVAFRRDPIGKRKQIVPVRIEECEVEGLLGPIVYIDLVKQDEQQARERLLAGVQQGRVKPTHVAFPLTTSRTSDKLPSLERPVFPSSLPPIWNVPYPRNMLFTGREELLTQLATSLHTGHPTAISQPLKDSQPQAISGLGGIGKTQLALEYAYRYRSEYQAVLWIQANTKDTLTTSYLELATLLDVPEKDAQESAQVIVAMKKWLQQTTGYLLILDNADDLAVARESLPPVCSGHVLLTTRAQSTGRFAQRLEVEVLPIEQSVEFLLRRAGLLSSDSLLEEAAEQDKRVAQEICEELGGLPLALDQAGAYIEETRCGLSTYLKRYQQQSSKLLAQRRGQLTNDHPLPVATTWKLSFKQVEQRSPAGADLLRVCAFLAPDAIPETIFTQGASYLGLQLVAIETDDMVLDEAIEALLAYSLVKRDAGNQTLSMHRLVQAVLKDQMEDEKQRDWAKRTVRGIHAILPPVEHEEWSRWEQLVSHILMCTKLIEEYTFAFAEGTELLQQTGWYLTERARYSEAEPLLLQAYVMSEREQGPEHIDTARNALTLAYLYNAQGKYTEAEPLVKRALAIREEQLGAMHPDTANSLNNLATLYQSQGKYEQAEPLLERALAIREEQLGAIHPETATSLNNLASLYWNQGKYAEAEPLYERALAIREEQLGAIHPSTASSLNNLASLYKTQGKYAEAEPLYERALAIQEEQLGATHPETARSLNNLASLYYEQRKYTEAEPLVKRAVHILKESLGEEHPNTATSQWWLATLARQQGKYTEAKELYEQAIRVYTQSLGEEHPTTQRIQGNYAGLLREMEQS